MAIFLTEEDVRRLLPIDEAIETVEQGLREQGNGTGVNIPRHRVQAGGRGITMMLSVLGERGVAGFKAMGAGGALVMLYGDEPARLLAVMQAGSLGQIRTGAATGVATRYMAREDSSTVGIIGTGNQAITQLEAVCAVRNIRSVKAFSRTPERREEFSRKMSESFRRRDHTCRIAGRVCQRYRHRHSDNQRADSGPRPLWKLAGAGDAHQRCGRQLHQRGASWTPRRSP